MLDVSGFRQKRYLRAQINLLLVVYTLMKTILCYGDSNTWGDPPGGLGRYEWGVRWPSRMQHLLGSGYRVVEEGLCGRTTAFDDPLWKNRNGLTFLPIALETHSPIDLLIIMLGNNDVKVRFNQTPFSIGQGLAQLVIEAKKSEPPIGEILIVSPPHVSRTGNLETALAFEGAIQKSKELAQYYQYIASQYGVKFFDAATVVTTSVIDGVHFDEENHKNLSEAITGQVESIFGSAK